MKSIQLELTVEETNLILEALGGLPFARVYTLIGRIQACAQQQLEPKPPEVVGNGADRENAT